jgi:hypothetical protein
MRCLSLTRACISSGLRIRKALALRLDDDLFTSSLRPAVRPSAACSPACWLPWTSPLPTPPTQCSLPQIGGR